MRSFKDISQTASHVLCAPDLEAMKPSISLRAATESDIPLVLELWRETMSPNFAAVGINSANEKPLDRIRTRFECAEIILFEGKPAGFFKVARDGKDWKLIQILLSPSLQRKGLGACLIADLISEARSFGASLSLSVLKQNPALELYLRMGFVIAGEEEHAFNMQLGANPA